MSEILAFERGLWGVTTCANIALVLLLLYRKNCHVYYFFFFYALLNLLQGVILFESHLFWGFYSAASFKIGWGTQGLIIIARALAVTEVCRRVLAKYRGIWALGWRVFVTLAALVLAYSWAVGGHGWQLFAVTADRSLELAIAVAILACLLFVHHYQVFSERAERFLIIGFFLYSCFQVLNDTILERWLQRYAPFWNLLNMLAFLASQMLWIWALRHAQPRTTFEPKPLPGDLYRSLSPAINASLKNLNERLGHFWGAEGEKT